VDHDKERRCRFVLAKNQLVRPQRDRFRGRDDVLDSFRFQSAKYRDPRNNLKISGRQF